MSEHIYIYIYLSIESLHVLFIPYSVKKRQAIMYIDAFTWDLIIAYKTAFLSRLLGMLWGLLLTGSRVLR